MKRYLSESWQELRDQYIEQESPKRKNLMTPEDFMKKHPRIDNLQDMLEQYLGSMPFQGSEVAWIDSTGVYGDLIRIGLADGREFARPSLVNRHGAVNREYEKRYQCELWGQWY